MGSGHLRTVARFDNLEPRHLEHRPYRRPYLGVVVHDPYPHGNPRADAANPGQTGGPGRPRSPPVQNLADLVGEAGRRERLLQEVHGLVQHPVADHGVVGVPAHVQHF